MKTLSLKHSKEQKIFFWSDLHHNHDKEFLWKKRGFSSVEEHNRILVERWNTNVTNNDIVFHLGDVCFSKDGHKNLLRLIDNLNYKELYLFPGNHTSGYHQAFRDLLESGGSIDKYWRLTDTAIGKTVHLVPNYFEVFVNGQAIVLSHYPLKCWNGHAHGSFCLHGHVHGSLYDSLSTTLDKGKILDVGVESCPHPISFDKVKTIMDKKRTLNESHHTSSTATPFA